MNSVWKIKLCLILVLFAWASSYSYTCTVHDSILVETSDHLETPIDSLRSWCNEDPEHALEIQKFDQERIADQEYTLTRVMIGIASLGLGIGLASLEPDLLTVPYYWVLPAISYAALISPLHMDRGWASDTLSYVREKYYTMEEYQFSDLEIAQINRLSQDSSRINQVDDIESFTLLREDLKNYNRLQSEKREAEYRKWLYIIGGTAGLIVFTPLILKGNTSGTMGSGYAMGILWMGEILSAGALVVGLTTTEPEDKEREAEFFIQKNF